MFVTQAVLVAFKSCKTFSFFSQISVKSRITFFTREKVDTHNHYNTPLPELESLIPLKLWPKHHRRNHLPIRINICNLRFSPPLHGSGDLRSNDPH
jgi:hypothetical protein